MKQSRSMIPVYIVLAIGAVILVAPFVYMLSTSLKSAKEVGQAGFSMFVQQPTFEAYGKLFDADLVGRAIFNSLFIAAITTAGNIFFGALAGYAFAKHKFPGRDLLFIFVLATMMIPGAILLVPGFLLYRDFGWLDTWLPLIVPGLCGAFSVFLSRQFILGVPDSLIEAAKIEGCKEFRIFWSVVMPVSKPLLATVGILTFLGSWNSFLGPLIMLLDERKYTLPLVIAMLQGRFPNQDNTQMAGAVISIAPVLILFFFFQKQIVSSLAASGLKEG